MLLNTVALLLELEVRAHEIIVVDQTREHDPDARSQLESLDRNGSISWVKMNKPSITEAMNEGLRISKNELVLFLDDDVIPGRSLISCHVEAHTATPGCWATAGQVIQPWQQASAVVPTREKIGLERDFDFPFNSTLDAETTNVMAGNLCVKRKCALSIGGFDENFIGSAYRFETDFARRIIQAGGQIRFVGSAGIHHLQAKSGGTRTNGSHLTSASPAHGFGDYYYAFRHGNVWTALGYSIKRIFGEVRTKFHLMHPWWIPVKLTGEIRALTLGIKASRSEPKLIDKQQC